MSFAYDPAGKRARKRKCRCPDQAGTAAFPAAARESANHLSGIEQAGPDVAFDALVEKQAAEGPAGFDDHPPGYSAACGSCSTAGESHGERGRARAGAHAHASSLRVPGGIDADSIAAVTL